ncbi:hypothetical protein LEN26_012241 [Aphanomyces euteiches]|nr:hypothetical protein LEN26_012241 [Aphanomyces euteiches]
MVDGGFYGSNPHESDRVVSSSHVFANEYPMLYKCIGALDGTNIPLVVNLDMQHRFRNRKGQTTTNAMGVVDETGRFLALFVGAEGCASDSFVFNMSNFERLIPDGHFYLGDAGYRLSPFLLTPYRNQRYHLREWAPNPDGRPKSAKELFNYRHSKARIVVERAFGIMKIKWKILTSNMNLDLDYAIDVIHACAALHNLAVAFNPCYLYTEISEEQLRTNQLELDEVHADAVDDSTNENWRDSIASGMWENYLDYRRETED